MAKRLAVSALLATLLADPAPAQPALPAVPPASEAGVPLTVSLPVALQLADVRPLDIAIAAERTRAAAAALQRANVLWLPDIFVGVDYARHDGQIQDIVGKVFTTGRSSFLVGAGPRATIPLGDALLAPLAARQVVRAREADEQAAHNDALLAVAEAYFNVQQARGELAGAAETTRRAEELVRRTSKLAPAVAPAVEINRARAELSRRRQAAESAWERWQTSGAELARLLRLEPAAIIDPVEPPALRVELFDACTPPDDLIPVALTHRPELASRQALVQATLARLRQERIRPLVPSLILQGNATNPAGTLSTGLFGGGINGDMSKFGGRNSLDAQALWQFSNLGFGNQAAVRERRAENQVAVIEFFRTQDRVAAEVVQALAQARRAAERVRLAEEGLRDAVETADKNLEGLGQTRRAGEALVPVFRPQEAVAAVQTLAILYDDYFRSVADANRAQFRLYRALGQPAGWLAQNPPCTTATPQP